MEKRSVRTFDKYIYHLCFMCIDFYDLSTLGGCWFVVYIRRFIYKFSNACPLNYKAVAGSGKVWPVNQVNHTSLVAIVTATDRLKSVGNRCVIELFVALFVSSLCPYDISGGVWAFVIELSQISAFFSRIMKIKTTKWYRLTYIGPATSSAMNSKCCKSVAVDGRTWVHVPSGTLWSSSIDTIQVVEIQNETSSTMTTQF